MAIQCPQCSREFDVTLFEFNRAVTCKCGNAVSFQHEKATDESVMTREYEERRIAEIRIIADRISYLIVSTDYPVFDVAMEMLKLKEKIEELFPDKIYLYDLIYAPRFRRLEEQFRNV